MNKTALRKVFLEKRKTLSTLEFEKRNTAIFEASIRFLKDQIGERKNIHLFCSIEAQYEVNTWPLIHWLQENGTQVILPKTEAKRQLTHHVFRKGDQLKTNSWGIPEPISIEPTHPKTLDVVFVPMICFDKSGNRIGYGGGFYDIFLNQVRADCLKVGLCLTPPLDEIPYIEKQDIALDHCITHLKHYSF